MRHLPFFGFCWKLTGHYWRPALLYVGSIRHYRQITAAVHWTLDDGAKVEAVSYSPCRTLLAPPDAHCPVANRHWRSFRGTQQNPDKGRGETRYGPSVVRQAKA